MQKKTKQLVAEREGKVLFEPFPLLIITADGVVPKGSHAEAQVAIFFNCLLLGKC
jgi:quinolinate synthase